MKAIRESQCEDLVVFPSLRPQSLHARQPCHTYHLYYFITYLYLTSSGTMKTWALYLFLTIYSEILEIFKSYFEMYHLPTHVSLVQYNITCVHMLVGFGFKYFYA